MPRMIARIPALSAALLLSIGLAACSADAPQAMSPRPVAATSGDVDGATPTPSAPAGPVVRIGAECADFSDALGLGAEVAFDDQASGVARSPLSANGLQKGSLHCDWGSESTPASGDGGVSQAMLSVSADPGSATGADAAPLAGAQPECAPGPDGATHECRVAGTAGRTWAWIMVISAEADTAKERIEAAQKAVSALLLQTRVAPAWSASTGSWPQIDGCAALGDDIDVSRAVGAAGPGSWADGGRGDAVDPIAYDDAYRGALDCTWQADLGGAQPKSTVFFTIAPAAEWAWPQLDALPGVTSTPLDVAGTDAASFRCASDAGTRSCWGDALVDHAWVQVSDAYGIDQQEATALLSAVVAGHAAS